MIKTRNLVPGVYYNESRDFQVLGRTFDILFNYLKTNVDLMEGIPFSNNCDTHLLPLVATSLGFANKRNYSDVELRALCSSFSKLLKIKGTKESIQEAVNVMLHAHNINKIADVEIDPDDKFNFIISVPEELDDTTILEDIFTYILPCGFTYRFLNVNLGKQYLGASLGVDQKIAYRTFDTTDSGNIGLIAKSDNIATPTMPTSGHIIQQDKTSMVSGGTIVVPSQIGPQPSGGSVVLTISNESHTSNKNYFRVYDGPSTAGTLLLDSTGNEATPSSSTLTCASGKITIAFCGYGGDPSTASVTTSGDITPAGASIVSSGGDPELITFEVTGDGTIAFTYIDWED